MREILFRGKRIDNDGWVEGSFIVFVGLRRWNKKFSDLYDELKEG